MKKINFVLLFLGIAMLSFSQTASLSLTFSLSFDSVSVNPDSIKISNLSSGGDTTLYGSDTILVLDYTTGLEHFITNANKLFLSQNYPNPYTKNTEFKICIEKEGEIEINVYEVTGKELIAFSGHFNEGTHKFSFLSGGGFFILKARYNNITRSIKMFSPATFRSKDYKIIYKGEDNLMEMLKSRSAINALLYTYGDQLRTVVYYQYKYKTTTFIPTQDTTIKVYFHSAPPCPVVFTDPRDNYVYSTVQIGSQCWMAENLAYLPSVYPHDSSSETQPFYYVYGYNGLDVSLAKATNNYNEYGVLYNWPAAMAGQASSNDVPSDVQGICPPGWHIPGDEEWKILEGETDSQYGYPHNIWNGTGMRGTDAGGNLKETGTAHWNAPNAGATNNSGFTALPAGNSESSGFFNIGDGTYFLSSTSHINGSSSWIRYLFSSNEKIGRGYYTKSNGNSIRCLKD